MASRDRRATLAHVAASAGVSVATVSKVLNGRNDVAPATRALVQELLHEYDYVARRAKPALSPAIELFFHGQLNAYHTEVLQGVVEAGAEAGVAVVVSVRPRGQRGSEAKRPAAWARELAGAGRQAAIMVTSELTGADLTALSRARLPVVVIDPLNLPSTRVTSVGSTNFAGGMAATHHLLDLGHRKIAYPNRQLERIVEPGDIEVMVGTSAADLPCRGRVRLTGPLRVVGHDRQLITPVELSPVAGDAAA